VGAVNCSAQHWAKNTEPLQCDKSSSKCAASSAWQLHQDSAVQTSTQSSSVAFSHNLSSPGSAALNNSLLLHIAPNHMDLNLHLYDNKTTTTNMHLQNILPDMSTESIYDSEFYAGDKENDVYDVEDSVPDYLNIKCTQKGIQCVDNTTIMGCSENMNEQFFAMSCNSLLYGDEGENVTSYCDNETSSCILISEGMTVTVSIKIANSEDLKICELYSGLRCVNNETLIACSGDASSIHYTVSCNGVATSETDSFLQGQCHENSCIFVTVNQTNISDIQESNIVNYDTYHLVSPDTNSTTTESPDRNISMTYDILPPNNHSSASKLLYTKINATYLWPPTYANSVISESLQTNIGVSQLLLPTDDDSAASKSLHSNKSETYYLMPLESNSTINESLYSIINVTYNILPPDADSAASDSPYSTTGVTYHLLPSDNDSFKIQSLYTHISSVTNTTDIHEEPDTPVMQVEMSDLYDKHEIIKYNLSMAGEEYFDDDSKTEINIANSPSSGNHDLVTYSAEKILQTTQHDSSQINDYLMADEKSPPYTAVSNADFELPPPPTGNSLEVMKSEIRFHSETSSLLNLDIPVTSETDTSMKNPASPTQISLSSSGSIVTEINIAVSKTTTRETISFAPEIIPKGPAILIFKSTPTETGFTVPETVPTTTLTPVSEVILTESFSALETKPTEIAIPVSKSSHTENDFPVPETLLTEITTSTTKSIETATAFSTHETVPIKTVTPISKLIHTENYFFVPEAVYTEITTPVSELMPTETLFTAPETVHQEMTPVSNTIDTKVAFSDTETVPTENVMLVSKLLHRETTYSVPETISTNIITHISTLIPTDTASPIAENATTEMTPVSKTIHTAMTFSSPGTLPKKMISESKTMYIDTVFPEITTTLSKIIPPKTVFPAPETVYTEITPLSKTIHAENVLSVPETVSVEMTTSISKLITTGKVYPDPDIVPTQMTPLSKTVHNEFGLFANESVPTESGVLILKPIHKETALSVPKPVSTEVTILVSNVTLIQTASPVPQIIPTQVIMPTSKLDLTETDFSVRQNIPTEAITPLSQLIPIKTAFPFSDNTLTEDTTPASKLIPTQTAPLLHETIPTRATAPVSKRIPIETASLVTKTIPTETMTSISKFIHREAASSIPALITGEIVNFNSGTTVNFSQPTMLVAEDKTMVSKLIPVTSTHEAGVSSITDLHSHLQAISSVSGIHSASETITSKPSAHVSEFMSTRSTRITPTAEMDQPERLVTASNAAMSKPSDISDIRQKNVCHKVGIQCIDRLTLGACLPDLTLSYTVSCQMLLPYVMSKHHDVYCNKKSDTCAMAPVL
jgi:hypothetical protein